MEEIKQHSPGTFSWIDLATTNLDAAKKFYSELFGLKAVDTPAGSDGGTFGLSLFKSRAASLNLYSFISAILFSILTAFVF